MSQRADDLAELLVKVRVMQENMTPSERKEFWSELQVGYCEGCGYADPNHVCQCWNDE